MPDTTISYAATGERWLIYDGVRESYVEGVYQWPHIQELDVLLAPSRLAPLLTFVDAEETTVQGEGAIRGVVRSLPPVRDYAAAAHGLAMPGATEVRVVVDRRRGIILRWETLYYGSVAHWVALSDLVFDQDLAEDLFVPPS